VAKIIFLGIEKSVFQNKAQGLIWQNKKAKASNESIIKLLLIHAII